MLPVVLIALVVALASCATPTAPVARVEPATTPVLYGAGLFTTGAWDFFMAFTSDQRRVLFCRADDAFERYEILETQLDDHGHWTAPVRPRFAREGSNADPHISPDGSQVFFISNRANPGETAVRTTFDIWVANRQADGEWGDAVRLPEPVNDPAVDEWSPSVAASGNLYFGSGRTGARGGCDLWMAPAAPGGHAAPERMSDAINGDGMEVEPWISPDERTLIFSALRRPDSLGSYDLYVSHRGDRGWTPARRLPEPINSTGRDFNQSVSPDGRWLYFSSTRPYSGPLGPRFDEPRDDATIRGIGNGKTGDIYRVPMAW